MASKGHIANRDEVFLAEDIVRNSPGFAFDIGSTLIKLSYRSKDDFCEGKPLHDKAIVNGRGRVHVVSIPRDSGATALCDFIKESCDVTKVKDTEEKLIAAVSGIGTNLWKEELDAQLNSLNIELSIILEDQVQYIGFQTLKETLSSEEFAYPLDEKGLQGAKEYAGVIRNWHKVTGNVSEELFSKITFLKNPVPQGVRPYLPCVLFVVGSGTMMAMFSEKGEFIPMDAVWFGGKSFQGFARYHFGDISFDELISVLESADGSTADVQFKDVVSQDSESDYSVVKDSTKRVFPFGKCAQNDKDGIKSSDMVYSLFYTLCEILAQEAHLTALSTGSRHIFYTGSFINIRLARQLITAELVGRNMTRPKNQQVEFSFVRHGAFLNSLGAFIKGAEKENKGK